MVKNVQGGSKTKSQARKSSIVPQRTALVRQSTEPLEVYACVIKMLGNKNCTVKTVCDKELRCVIRKKFSGRFKRQNKIDTGSILLVGLHEWESKDKCKSCDVLEVYDNEEHMQLKSIPKTKVQLLDKYITSLQKDGCKEDDVLFTEDEPVHEYTVTKQTVPLFSLKEVDEDGQDKEDAGIDEEEIHIDDI